MARVPLADGEEFGRLVEFLVVTADHPEALFPEFHVHDADRIPWFDTSDSLGRYPGDEQE